MPTNIEKLCDEINALMDEDPQSFECTDATISTEPGERRIYLNFWASNYTYGYIDFKKIIPYDPDGAPGTTGDVYDGASLHVTVTDTNDLPPEFIQGLRKSYPERLYIPMRNAARAGTISSKILAGWPISRRRLLQEARHHLKAAKEHKKAIKEFLAEQDPVTRRALKAALADAKAAQKKKKSAASKRPNK